MKSMPMMVPGILMCLGWLGCSSHDAAQARQPQQTQQQAANPSPPAQQVDASISAQNSASKEKRDMNRDTDLQTATLAGGCFWCTEAVFQRLKGVKSIVSGYTGGRLVKPTYEQVLTGRTGHAEAIQVEFDPQRISYEDLLLVFFATHDPTTLNRQGPDVGTQYRSAIFCHDEQQRETAEQVKEKLDESQKYRRKIVTKIEDYKAFYPAELYHQNFFNRNPQNPYCRAIIPPKLEKLRSEFAELLQDTKRPAK